jgi:hypothetical protein
MQKRERVPLTGRSTGSRNPSVGNSPSVSARSSMSNGSLPTERKEQLNNPIEVFRKYEPEIIVRDAHLKRPPILPKNRFKTVPDEDPTLGVPTIKRKAITPASFVESNLTPSWFETMDQSTLLDVEGKVIYCRDFIERNRDRLWKFDLKYMGLTPQAVATDLTTQPGLMTKMKKFANLERSMRLSSSEQFTASFRDDHLGNSKGMIERDPFISSMQTSRSAKAWQMTNLMTSPIGPGAQGGAGENPILQYGTKNQRGYAHTTGYGNFSKFNGMLQLNKSSMLNR